MVTDKVKVQVVDTTAEEKQVCRQTSRRVISINGVKVPTNRKIFIGGDNRFWYQSTGMVSACKYHITSMGYQAITLNGNRYEAYPKRIEIEIVNSVQDSTLRLEENKVYRLNNGTKIQIVAKVAAGDFASVSTWVAVYKNGTARYAIDGKLLSHGGDSNWAIASEWKNVDLWTVTVQLKGDYHTHTFHNERAADVFIRNAGGTALAKTKVSI